MISVNGDDRGDGDARGARDSAAEATTSVVVRTGAEGKGMRRTFDLGVCGVGE